ncbi:RNA polymerase sigma-70 factor [Hymenobacter sp. HMF4947]|uniref:RNA polymerase sigma-70 factor n=1 Tax=Hymenobacter ginkgonis TaxID=2682976 RepID=A0A7K1TGR3_9BACT|nr:RNA polymerase sigma-70 factor [Hymenobacter ginkgonis]MVN77553.1 RNA polymerase sigma-70 factor [Hymenobacter ginkgonis]
MKLTKHVSEIPASPALESEEELFKRLFKQHASSIYRLANKELRSQVEAQEIVQECFLKFWEKRHEISVDPTAAKGYLYTCAYHAILNQVRRQHTWLYQDCSENLVMQQASQSMELEYQELSLCYTHALAQLPAKRREIFIMSRQQGLSNAMIAQELNISVKTIEAQMTHALKFIRQYFILQGVLPSLVMLLVEAFCC